MFPTIFEPSHRMSASQKMYIMFGVPDPARNKKAVDKVVKNEPIIATSDLNQRFSSKMMKSAANTAITMDGNLIE